MPPQQLGPLDRIVDPFSPAPPRKPTGQQQRDRDLKRLVYEGEPPLQDANDPDAQLNAELMRQMNQRSPDPVPQMPAAQTFLLPGESGRPRMAPASRPAVPLPARPAPAINQPGPLDRVVDIFSPAPYVKPNGARWPLELPSQWEARKLQRLVHEGAPPLPDNDPDAQLNAELMRQMNQRSPDPLVLPGERPVAPRAAPVKKPTQLGPSDRVVDIFDSSSPAQTPTRQKSPDPLRDFLESLVSPQPAPAAPVQVRPPAKPRPFDPLRDQPPKLRTAGEVQAILDSHPAFPLAPIPGEPGFVPKPVPAAPVAPPAGPVAPAPAPAPAKKQSLMLPGEGVRLPPGTPPWADAEAAANSRRQVVPPWQMTDAAVKPPSLPGEGVRLPPGTPPWADAEAAAKSRVPTGSSSPDRSEAARDNRDRQAPAPTGVPWSDATSARGAFAGPAAIEAASLLGPGRGPTVPLGLAPVTNPAMQGAEPVPVPGATGPSPAQMALLGKVPLNDPRFEGMGMLRATRDGLVPDDPLRPQQAAQSQPYRQVSLEGLVDMANIMARQTHFDTEQQRQSFIQNYVNQGMGQGADAMREAGASQRLGISQAGEDRRLGKTEAGQLERLKLAEQGLGSRNTANNEGERAKARLHAAGQVYPGVGGFPFDPAVAGQATQGFLDRFGGGPSPGADPAAGPSQADRQKLTDLTSGVLGLGKKSGDPTKGTQTWTLDPSTLTDESFSSLADQITAALDPNTRQLPPTVAEGLRKQLSIMAPADRDRLLRHTAEQHARRAIRANAGTGQPLTVAGGDITLYSPGTRLGNAAVTATNAWSGLANLLTSRDRTDPQSTIGNPYTSMSIKGITGEIPIDRLAVWNNNLNGNSTPNATLVQQAKQQLPASEVLFRLLQNLQSGDK